MVASLKTSKREESLGFLLMVLRKRDRWNVIFGMWLCYFFILYYFLDIPHCLDCLLLLSQDFLLM